MIKNINFSLLSLALLLFTLSGCEKLETAEPISPSGYPVATITSDATSDVLKEGDIVTYTIKLDKMLEHDLTFSLLLDENSEVGDSDLLISGEGEVVIPAFSTEAQLTVEILSDNVPEEEESLAFEIGVYGLDYRYNLKPNTSKLAQAFKVVNVNEADALTIAIEWPSHDDDWDMYFIDEAGAGYLFGETTYDWSGFQGATGANPEIFILKDGTLPWNVVDGTYYVDADPYEVSESVTDFVIRVGYADQSVDIFNAHFDKANADKYPAVWAYSLLKVVRAGDKYTCKMVPGYEM